MHLPPLGHGFLGTHVLTGPRIEEPAACPAAILSFSVCLQKHDMLPFHVAVFLSSAISEIPVVVLPRL